MDTPLTPALVPAAQPTSELEEVLAAAERLPLCDDAAKLHALVARVQHAARTGGNLAGASGALAAAATASLAHDPWVAFEAAARRLRVRLAGASPASPADLQSIAPPGRA